MLNFLTTKHKVEVSPSIVVFTTFFLLFLYGLYYVRAILTILFLAFIIMVALNPMVTYLQKKLRLPRPISIFAVYALVISVVAFVLNLILPPLISELYLLVRMVNIPVLQDVIRDVNLTMSELTALADRVGSSVGMVFSIVTSTFTGVFTFFTLMVLSFYMIIDRPHLHKKAAWFTRNPETLKRVEDFLNSIEVQLGGWVRGQIILMSVIGTITYVGLALLGVPYALPLAILAGLLEILPNLGPTIAAVPAVILAYISAGPIMAGVVVIFYLVVQGLENNLIVPKILKDNVDVNPLISIVTILIGVQVGGVIGAILAIPTYLLVRTFYGIWLKDQILSK